MKVWGSSSWVHRLSENRCAHSSTIIMQMVWHLLQLDLVRSHPEALLQRWCLILGLVLPGISCCRRLPGCGLLLLVIQLRLWGYWEEVCLLVPVIWV